MKAWAQSLLEDARALASEGRRACEWLGVRVPAFLQGDPSPRTLELLAEARAIGGAYRFHQWAANQLPANVREHYGERFVLGANHLLKGTFASLSVADNMSKEKLKPSVSLDCPVCSCDADDGKRADCLIDRFHRAFDSIDSDYIAEMPAATRSTQSFRANSTPLLAARRRSRHGRAEHRNIRARPHPDSAARVPRMVNHLPPSAIRI